MQEYLCRAVPHSDRKYRLFASACCRQIGHLLYQRSLDVLNIVERFADGLAAEQELRSARTLARKSRDDARAALTASVATPAAPVETSLSGTWLGACAVLHSAGSGAAWRVALSAADSAAEAPAWVAAALASGVLTRRAEWNTDESAPWSVARKHAARSLAALS
jgi:hypothetical protein